MQPLGQRADDIYRKSNEFFRMDGLEQIPINDFRYFDFIFRDLTEVTWNHFFYSEKMTLNGAHISYIIYVGEAHFEFISDIISGNEIHCFEY